MLMRMDRGASRPEGVGGIPRLTAPGEASRRWRPGVLLVILVGMLACASLTAAVLRSRKEVPTPARVSASMTAPTPVPSTPTASAAEQRVAMLVGQGIQAAQEGELSEAVRLLRKALELKPAESETWNSLGVVLVRQGDTAGGMDAFRQALRLDPDHPEVQRNLAVVLDREGRSAEAVTHYQAFLRLSAESDPARDAVRRRLATISGPR
jgi:cytochrome c-type biogenesis protein CcmH/NrfG